MFEIVQIICLMLCIFYHKEEKQTTKISRFYKINTNYYWFNIHNLKSMKYKIVKFIVFTCWHDIMNRKFHAIKLF